MPSGNFFLCLNGQTLKKHLVIWSRCWSTTIRYFSTTSYLWQQIVWYCLNLQLPLFFIKNIATWAVAEVQLVERLLPNSIDQQFESSLYRIGPLLHLSVLITESLFNEMKRKVLQAVLSSWPLELLNSSSSYLNNFTCVLVKLRWR